MKNIFFLIIAIFFSIFLFSQEKTVWNNNSSQFNDTDFSNTWEYRTRDAFTDLRYKTGRTLSDYEYNEIIGNSYYNKEFVIGKIYLHDKKISKIFTLRYNAFSDEIEIGTNKKFESLINNRNISCLIGKDLYVYHPFVNKEGDAVQTGYLRIIFEAPEFKFLIRETKVYKEGKKAQTTLQTSFPAKVVDSKKFYFINNLTDNAVLIIQKNKKVIDIIDSQYKSKMSEFLKGKSLNVKNDEDLITFFKHYTTLISNKKKNL